MARRKKKKNQSIKTKLFFVIIVTGIFVWVNFINENSVNEYEMIIKDKDVNSSEDSEVNRDESLNINQDIVSTSTAEQAPIEVIETATSGSKTFLKLETPGNENKIKLTNENTVKEIFLEEAPFTSQAPLGEWDDIRQQDGCEESSSLMAVSWARGESFTLDEARMAILDISKFEEEEYGNYVDTSVADTQKRILVEYFKFENSYVLDNVTIEEMITELVEGNVIIVPVDGVKIKNKYYTPPGPERHMLLVVGYDVDTSEFITNDPGTKNGKGYRYDKDHFHNSIRDYPTGDHAPIKREEKNVIVVSKK